MTDSASLANDSDQLQPDVSTSTLITSFDKRQSANISKRAYSEHAKQLAVGLFRLEKEGHSHYTQALSKTTIPPSDAGV
jgi:hypothetical protein